MIDPKLGAGPFLEIEGALVNVSKILSVHKGEDMDMDEDGVTNKEYCAVITERGVKVVENETYDELTQRILTRMEELEKTIPW